MDRVVQATVTRKDISPGQVAVKVSKKSFDTYHVTARSGVLSRPKDLADFVRQHEGKIVAQDVFGSCDLYEDGLRSFSQSFGRIEWPITWIEGQNCRGHHACGTQFYVISGTNVEPICVDGRNVGGVYEDDDAVYCILGGILSSDKSKPRPEQVAEVFGNIESALQSAGMDFGNVVRTWLYLDDILSWYDEFNAVRARFFSERGIYDAVVPASTGIGVRNPAGTAAVANVLAIKPKTGHVRIQAVPSPLQSSALDYGSSFSRAIEVTLPDLRQLYISGTASIDLGGDTVFIDNIEGQVNLTMEVVRAILLSRDMEWSDVNRAIAYFKRCEDISVFDRYCQRYGLTAMPVAVSHADICRDNLLFEIEIDAAQPARDTAMLGQGVHTSTDLGFLRERSKG